MITKISILEIPLNSRGFHTAFTHTTTNSSLVPGVMIAEITPLSFFLPFSLALSDQVVAVAVVPLTVTSGAAAWPFQAETMWQGKCGGFVHTGAAPGPYAKQNGKMNIVFIDVSSSVYKVSNVWVISVVLDL
jgi:hypothetical protein